MPVKLLKSATFPLIALIAAIPTQTAAIAVTAAKIAPKAKVWSFANCAIELMTFETPLSKGSKVDFTPSVITDIESPNSCVNVF